MTNVDGRTSAFPVQGWTTTRVLDAPAGIATASIAAQLLTASKLKTPINK
jgi:hypothetical protein